MFMWPVDPRQSGRGRFHHTHSIRAGGAAAVTACPHAPRGAGIRRTRIPVERAAGTQWRALCPVCSVVSVEAEAARAHFAREGVEATASFVVAPPPPAFPPCRSSSLGSRGRMRRQRCLHTAAKC